jgi:glycerol-3-phosphate acyltransferase PlsX
VEEWFFRALSFMRLAVDVMGGDHGPGVVIDGVRMALRSHPSISEIFLVGREDEITPIVRRIGLNDPRVRIVHATEVLTMSDKPVEALRRKKDCSIVRAVSLIKEGKADALVSPGNTGGIVAASTISLRPIEGLDRPCLATVIPAALNEFVLLDVGANVECRPSHLLHFAIMGSIYSREILGCASPRVGILSNGKEANKGTEMTKEASRLCQLANLNFIGNVEGHDLFNNEVDVVVCDGFTGNIVLKTMESFAKSLTSWLKAEVSRNPKRILGALLLRGALRTISHRTDPDVRGGAPLLGLNGVIFKAHGSSRERAIMGAIDQAVQAAEHHITDIIRAEAAQANERLTAVQI